MRELTNDEVAEKLAKRPVEPIKAIPAGKVEQEGAEGAEGGEGRTVDRFIDEKANGQAEGWMNDALRAEVGRTSNIEHRTSNDEGGGRGPEVPATRKKKKKAAAPAVAEVRQLRAVVSGKELGKLCRQVRGACGKGATLPILRCFLIEANERQGTLWVHGTDLDVRIWGRVAAEVSGDWQVAVSGAKLCAVLEAVEGDAEVTMVVRGGYLELASGTWHAMLYGLAPEEFPPEGDADLSTTMCSMAAGTMRRALELVAPCASVDGTRYAINGVRVAVSEGGTVGMQATDGRRLGMVSVLLGGEDVAQCTLPNRFVALLRGLLDGGEDVVDMTAGWDKARKLMSVTVMNGDAVWIEGKVIDGTWPNTAQVVPDGVDAEWVELELAGFAGMIERASGWAQEKVTIQMVNRSVKMHSAAAGAGEWDEDREAITDRKQPAKFFEVALNPAYAAAVGALKCCQVEVNIKHARDGGPLHFTANEDVGEDHLHWEYVLMPMGRVEGGKVS
jgi:DNA polymerase III sliding clamp (beta) subunit (PCNA family)